MSEKAAAEKADHFLRPAKPSHWVARTANVLFGRRLASNEERKQKIGWLAGVPYLGLDALASAAYGPEAALTLLIPLGLTGLGYIEPILGIIVLILVVVGASYFQTIAAYPSGGGSYTVARDNFGEGLGLLAGAALGIDYVLNVAVGISAGVGAVVSAFPALLPHTLWLCLGLLVILTLLNLRGVREVGVLFIAPTYLFVGCLLATITLGIAREVAAGGHPMAVTPLPHVTVPMKAVSLWILLRTFASGCTAMTGVEAVANAVPIFREPPVREARRTLVTIVVALAILLLGLSHICRVFGIMATPPGSAGYQSVLSEILEAVAGRGGFYYVSMAAVFTVLALSANTSFAGFPRLCRLMALDEFLPEAFAWRGRRLVYNEGIAVLSLLAAMLLLLFRGVTNGLIPLFAVGALLSFTLSQAGMVRHWQKQPAARGRGWKVSINAVGAMVTGITVLLVMISKFTEGAWIVLLLLPVMVFSLRRIQSRHRHLRDEIRVHAPLNCRGLEPPIVVVPMAEWTVVTEKALRFSMRLSREVYAVQVVSREVAKENLAVQWPQLVEAPARAAECEPPRLKVLTSRYRQVLTPVAGYVRKLVKEHPGRIVAVVVPELVVQRWYHYLLGYATLLRGLLLLWGNSQIVVITAPWFAEPSPL